MVLGEMPDDPNRRPRVVEALGGLEEVRIPEPMDLSKKEVAQKKSRLLEATDQAILEMSQESGGSERNMGRAIAEVAEVGLISHYLNDSDFGTAARMMDRAVFEAWRPKSGGAKRPKP